MEKQRPTCPICGGSSYYKESGFFYCVECQTQSQELREEILEEHHYQGAQVKTVRTPALAARKATLNNKESSWTTWEMYNFILKGMVEELILLGAKPSLKLVVLQLWARYLQKLEVAFTSKRNEKLPRLGIRFHKKDAELIYGAKIGTKKIKAENSNRKNTSSVASDSVETSHFGSYKKALFQSEYDKQLALSASDTTSLFEQSLKNMDTSGTSDTEAVTSSLHSRIHLSKKAQSLRKKISLKTRSKSSAEKIKKNWRSQSVLSYHRIIDSHHPYCLTRQKLPALLYLALLLNGDPIQLSDILRWIREGELSFHEVTHFFPDELRIKGMDRAIFDKSHINLSYKCLRKASCGLAHITRVTVLPSPDWLYLISRYVMDLELPAQLVKYVERLIVVSQPVFEFNAFSKILPNCEGRAMAFLIVTLKMLLGLDGKTEHEISKTALALNRLLEEDGVQLFVWDEWVKYIEYRKSILSEFHFPLQTSLDRDGFYNPANFIRFWTKMKTKDRMRQERIVRGKITRINENWIWPLKHALLKLTEADSEEQEEQVSFVPSVTPNKSSFDTLKRVHPTLDIFKQDFASASVDFMLKPKLFAQKASEKGVNVIIKCCSARKNYKKCKEIHQKRNVKTANLQMEVISTSKGSASKEKLSDGGCSDIRVKKRRRQDSMEETGSRMKACKKKRKEDNDNSPRLSQKGIKANNSIMKKMFTNHKAESTEENSQKSKILKLYVPHTHYWMLEVSYMNGFDDFKAQVWTKFPTTFQWLLTECARLLEMSVQDLYSEVLLIEKLHNFVLRPKKKKKNAKLKRKISSVNKEWQM